MTCGVNKFNRSALPVVNVMVSASLPMCVDWILEYEQKEEYELKTGAYVGVGVKNAL